MPKMVGPPKKHFVFLILLSLFVLSFFFFSQSPSSNPDFSTPIIDSTKNLTPQITSSFTFLIKVLAFNRLHSVSRCLRSLAAADYAGDTVHLHVYLDHFAAGNDSADVSDRKLEESRQILEFVDGFAWRFGNKVVHYRTGNVGLQAQWLEAWWPSSDDEFAFIVEDDLEVSPLFYKFVRAVILNYRYNASNFSPSIFGVTLQRPRFVPGKHGNKIELDKGTRVFLYQLVGTWGQILFPKPWKEFRLWYDDHKVKGVKPFLDGMVTNGWYKKKGERIWTPWFIKFVHSRGYFNIYTNFQHERALSVSHRDTGVNYGKSAGPDSQLVDETSLDFNLLEMHPLSNLKWYDFCFSEVLPGRIIRNLDEIEPVFKSVQKLNTVMMVSVIGASDAIVRNLFCHFERLNVRNYVLVGRASDFLFDLARRGHPVIVADELGKNMRDHKLVNAQDSPEYVLLKAYLMKRCLEHGLNAWIVDATVILVNSKLLEEELTNPTNHFYASKTLEIFFARSSSSVQKVMADGFLDKITSMVNEASSGNRNIAQLLSKLLEHNSVSGRRVDDTEVGMEIDDTISVNSEGLSGKKMVYWSKQVTSNSIQKRLEELNMWALDGECSCKAVVCHKES